MKNVSKQKEIKKKKYLGPYNKNVVWAAGWWFVVIAVDIVEVMVVSENEFIVPKKIISDIKRKAKERKSTTCPRHVV